MDSRLSRFCAAIIEAVWVVAILIIPLYFNPYSSRIFEPDKAILLRTLSIIAFGAWVIKFISDRIQERVTVKSGIKIFDWLFRNPIIVTVIITCGVYLIATIFSINLNVSFWGSYQRSQGFYTTISYIVIFFTIVTVLRDKEQVERIFTLIILTSLPIALYGILQRYGLDPIPWVGDVVKRSTSTLGNSIFLGAFLIMAFPITLLRVIRKFKIILNDQSDMPIGQTILATLYVFIAILQIIALYLSGSRGPFVGWVISLFLFILIYSFTLKRRLYFYTIFILVTLAGVFLLVLNLGASPLNSLRELPGVGRFGQILDPQSNSAQVRKYIWQGALDLMITNEPLKFPGGQFDRFDFLRPLFGYGPETMFVAFMQHYVPELGQVERRSASPDRSHNETWDSLIITGIFGFVVYISLFSALFYSAMSWMGLVVGKREIFWFFSLYIGSGLLTSAALIIWRGIEYFGIGLPIGLVIGLFLYLFVRGFSRKSVQTQKVIWDLRFGAILALFTAIVAHFIEINFGISVVSTKLYFWVFLALLYLIGTTPRFFESKITSKSNTPVNIRQKRGIIEHLTTSSPIYSGLIIGLILVTLGFDFIGNQAGKQIASSVLISSFFNSNPASGAGIVLLFATTLAISSLLLSIETQINQSNLKWIFWVRLVATVLLAGVVTFIYWFWHAASLASLTRTSIQAIDDVLKQAMTYNNILMKYYIYLSLCTLSLSIIFFLTKFRRNNFRRAGVIEWVSCTVVSIIVLLAIQFGNLRFIHADMTYKLADSYVASQNWAPVIRLYHTSNELAPEADIYHSALAKANLEYARQFSDIVERDRLIKNAEEALLSAIKLNPLNPDNTINLARLYFLWSSLAEDPKTQITLSSKADEYFSLSEKLSPFQPRIWNEWALLYLTNARDIDRAYRLLSKSLELDPTYDWTYGLIGDYFSYKAKQTTDRAERDKLLQKAVDNYSKAIDFVKYYDIQNKASYLVALGGVFVQLEKNSDAIDLYEQALKIIRGDMKWRIYETLANLYRQSGDYVHAIEYAKLAVEAAPENQRDHLLDLIKRLGGSP